MKNVVIIGGGISGLSVAWHLCRSGISVTVLEKEPGVGGTMRTIHEDGWLIETGPNSALETTPLFRQMFDDLGIATERIYADERASKRYILRGDTLHPLPMSPGAFLSSTLWSAGGKLRLLKEPFVGRADKEESIAEFVERRLGREFLDYAINPFVAGVYAGNPEQLSVRAAFPKLYALEDKYGGLIKGMIKGRRDRAKRAEQAKDRARMFSFIKGMQTFPDALARQLGERITTGAEVDRIHFDQANHAGKFRVDFTHEGREMSIRADAVVLTIPATCAAGLISPYSPELAADLRTIYYPPVTQVFMGFKESQVGIPLDGFGYLIPAVERRKILGTIWSSVLFPQRAPAGHVAFTTFVGGARQPDIASLDDRALLDVVLHELKSLMKISGSAVYQRIIRWERAIPQYNLGYQRIITSIEALEKSVPGIHLGGNYRGGISVGDCVMSGERLAKQVIHQLGKETHASATQVV